MTLERDLEDDIKRFFNEIEPHAMEDKRKSLKLLIDKYIHIVTADVMLEKTDYDRIVSSAKYLYSNEVFPKYLGDNYKEVGRYENEGPNLCLIEATVSHLNSLDCLRKIAKFDYRKPK